MVADRAGRLGGEPDARPVHRRGLAAVPAARLRQQRLQPFHAWKTSPRRGVERSTADREAAALTLPGTVAGRGLASPPRRPAASTVPAPPPPKRQRDPALK